jgi:leader peptidase (prepilin peptidase)/N-methyltransferase
MITYVLSPSPVVVLFVALVVVGTWLGAVDLACRRLPRSVVVATTAGAALYLLVLAGVTGDWGAFGRALLGAAVLGLVYLGLYLLPGHGLGFGDVRLAVLLGLCLGYLGWRPVLIGALLPWLINGPVALVLLLLGKVSRTSRLPLGPAMLVGALLAIGISGLLNLEI